MGENKKRSFKVEGQILDIPETEVKQFLKDVPDAVEVKSFTVDQDTLDVPVNEVDQFLKDVPDAKPLFVEEEPIKKKSTSELPTTPTATERGGGFAPLSDSGYDDFTKELKPKADQLEKQPLPTEIQSKAFVEGIYYMPESLQSSRDAKLSYVTNFSKKTKTDPATLTKAWDQSVKNLNRIKELEKVAYPSKGEQAAALAGPQVDLTKQDSRYQEFTQQLQQKLPKKEEIRLEGYVAPEVTVTSYSPETFKQRSNDLYELAMLYNYFGDYTGASNIFWRLEGELKKQAEQELQDPNFRARAPKNYIEQRQAPATKGLAYTAYLSGDRAEYNRINKILSDKGLSEKMPELPQVGTGDILQPSYTAPTYGFKARPGAEYTAEEGVLPASRPTEESAYLNDMAKAIEQSTLFGPAYQMAEMGIGKTGEALMELTPGIKQATQVAKYGSVGNALLNSYLKLAAGTAEAIAGVAGMTTGAGSVFALPFFAVQNNLPPEVAEWMMPVSKLIRNHYADKGLPVPEYAENAGVLADFAGLALLHTGATKGVGMAKGRVRMGKQARTFRDWVDELTPADVEQIMPVIEKRWEAAGKDPEVYAAQVKERVEEIKPQIEALEVKTESAPEPYNPPPAPESLRTITEGSDIEMNGEVGKIERGDDGTWYFVNDKGESKQIPVADKFNPTEKLTELGIQVLPEVSKADIARAMADAEQVGYVEYNGKRYFVSLDRTNKANPIGDRVLEVRPDGSMIDRFSSHPDPKFAADRMLAITNAMLESKGLPKRSKNITPWKESERFEVEGGSIAYEPETVNMTGGKGQYLFYDQQGNARVITEQEYLRLKESGNAVKVDGQYQPGYEGYEQGPTEKVAVIPSEQAVAGPKIEAPVAIEQQEVARQMKPITDEMVALERQFENEGYKIDTTYDNEIIVSDKKGELVDPEDLPENLQTLAGQYESAVRRLGEFDSGAMEAALAESRKVVEAEAIEVKPEIEAAAAPEGKAAPIKEVTEGKPEMPDIQNVLDNAKYTPRRKNGILIRLPIDFILQNQELEFMVRRGLNEIGNRIDKAKNFLLKRPTELEASDIYIKDTGRNKGKIGFADGRHRLIAAKELGATHAMFEIEATKEQFDALNYLLSEFGNVEGIDFPELTSKYGDYKIIQTSDNTFLLNKGNDVINVKLNESGGVDNAIATKNGKKYNINNTEQLAIQEHLQKVNPESNQRNINKFLGKPEAAPVSEAKPEVEAELTPEETTVTEEIKITQDEAKRAKQASPKRTRKSKDITAVIESETKAVESSGNAARAKDLIETVEATEQSILTDRPTKDTFEQKHGVSETAILQEMADMGKTGDFGKAYKNLTGKEPTIEAEIDFLSAVSSEGGKVKPKMSIEFTEENNTVETLALPKKKATKSGIDSLKEIVSDDETRPVMQGIYFEDGNMIATDAHKLTIIPQTESFDVIVDKAAEARYKTYKKIDPSYTREKAKAQILEKLGGDLNGKIIDFVKGEVVEGKYPNYKSVIPDYKTSVTVDAQKLIDEVNGARAVQNNLQDNVFAIGIELNGETVYFNPRLLADVIETLQGNGAKKFELLSEGQKNRPIIIKTDNGMTGLVMPLEVKGEYPRSQSIKPTELGGIKGKQMPKTKVESAAPAEAKPSPLRNAINELKDAQAKYRSNYEKPGFAFDPKKQAQDLYDLHQAYIKVAKEAIKEGVRTLEEFAKLVPAMTKGAMMAFEEAMGKRVKLNVADFDKPKLTREYNEPYVLKGPRIKTAIKQATEMPIGAEYKNLVTRIKAEVKAAIDGYKAGKQEVREQWAAKKAQNKEFAQRINDIMEGLKGKVDPKTAKRLVKKALDATTPARMRKFEAFADKAIMRANYIAELDRANNLRTKLKNMISGKEAKKRLGANNVAIIDQFSKIRPEDLEDFTNYFDIAERLIESNKPMQYDKATGGVKRMGPVISNAEVANFLAEHQNKLEQMAREDIRAEFQDLIDMGVIDPDTMTSDDMMAIIDSIENTDQPITDETLAQIFERQIAEIATRQGLTAEGATGADWVALENKRLALAEKVLKAFQDAAKYSQMNLEKYFVEEAQALTERQRRTINDLLDIDTEQLTKDQSLLVNRTIQNIINNNSFAGADQVAGVIGFNQKAVAKAKAIIGKEPIKELGVASKVARSKDLMIEKITGSVNKAANLKLASGIEQMWNNVAKMKNRFHDLYDNTKKDSYIALRDKLSKRDGIDYNTIRNQAIRGMYAKMIKNFGGSEAEIANEFMRHKRQVAENIKAYLSAGGEVQFDSLGYIKEDANGRPVFTDTVKPSQRTLRLRQEGELLFEIYNELFKDANNAFDLQRKILKDAKGNVELVDRAIDINKSIENDFFESAEMDQNKIDLDRQTNYTRDKYKSSIDQPLNRESTTDQLFNTVFSPRSVKDRATGSMNTVIRSDKAYKGRLLNFNFDAVFRDALHEDLFAMSTSKNINQLKELFRSGDANKVFGNEANARAIKNMLVRAIDIQRNEHAPSTDMDRLLWRATAQLAVDAGRIALLGASQIAKQFFGVATGSILTNGPKEAPRMLRYFSKGFANMNHPMLNEFNISQRGTILGGFFQVPSGVITERGLVEKGLYDKVVDMRKKVGDALGEPLGKGDAGVARATWWMHYLDYLHKQGVDVDAIDFDTIAPDYNAAAYAEQMVSRMQNANDRASMPELYSSGNAWAKVARDFVLPFSSFGVNQNRRMANDIDRIINGPKEERKQAYNAFLSTAAEQFVFNAMKVYILGNMTSTGADLIAQYFDVDDEEKNKYKDVLTETEKRTMTEKVLWNSLEDFTMSGIPMPVRTPLKQGFNKMYNAVTGSDDKFNNGPFYIYQTTQDPDFPAWLDYMGVYGTIGKTGYDLYDLSSEALLGKTEGFEGVESTLTQGEKRMAQMMFLIDAAALSGISDQDLTIMNSKLKSKYRKHMLGTYGGEIEITVGKKPSTAATFLRSKQDPADRAETFIKVWNNEKISEEDLENLIKQGVEDGRTFSKKFDEALKQKNRKIYNRYRMIKNKYN